jgi:tetratricopeptide (TPR) repeat protein
MAPDVFISYCNHSDSDKRIADAVCESLEQSGLACWIAPRDVPPGAFWDEHIIDAINNTPAKVLILSAKANDSRYVQSEVCDAFSKGKAIFVLRVEDVPPAKSLGLYLGRSQWTDAFNPPIDQSINRLAAAILALRERSPQRGGATGGSQCVGAFGHRAFLAATGRDLPDHVRRGIDQLHAAGFEVVPWDRLDSTDQDLTSFAEKDLDGCELYVLLLAFRRGPMVEGENESVTQVSLRRAGKRGIKTIVFVLDEDSPWPPRLIESRRDPAIETWRRQIQETLRPRTFGSEPASLDLRPLLQESIQELEGERIPVADPEVLRRSVLEAAKRQVGRAVERLEAQGKYKPESYVRRRLDYVLDRFYTSPDRTCVLIVDDPGTGKSSLLAFQASQLVDHGVPCVLLASDEYLDFAGTGCATFEDFALRALKAHLADLALQSSECFSSLNALCDALPAAIGTTKFVVLLDGLNEIHSAGQASQGYQQDSIIGSKALLSFVETAAPGQVKLLVTSRRLTWAKLYETDSREWRQASWEPNWLALYEGDFLGGVPLQDLLPAALGSSAMEPSAGLREKLLCLSLGPFTDLEAGLALGGYQRVNRVRVAPGPVAFRQLADPFFLGICFSAWSQRREERAETWHYVRPRDEFDSPGELRIPVVDAFDSFDLMAGFWQTGENRIMARARREAPLAAMGPSQVRALLHHTVDQMTRMTWATGSDRVPSSTLADNRPKDLVKQAMIAEEMVVEETSQDGERQLRFPRDRVAGFHIVRHVRDQLNLGREAVLREFIEKAEEVELFGGLLEMVLNVCLKCRRDLAWELLETAVWREGHQPQWFIEVCQHLPRLDGDMREQVVASVLWRFASFLVPRQALGEMPAAETARREHVASALGAQSGQGRAAADPAVTLGGLPVAVVLSLPPVARQLISQLPRFFSSAREVAEGIEKMVDCVMRRREQRQDIEKAASQATRPTVDPGEPGVAQAAAPPEGKDAAEETTDQPAAAAAPAGEAKAGADSGEDSGELSLEHEYHNLANDYYRIGEFDKAIEHYDKALELRPDLLETYFNRGLAYTRKGLYDRALEDLSQVIELNPNLPEAYYTRGLVHEYKLEYDLAILDYNQALEVDPTYSKAETQRQVAFNKKASLASYSGALSTSGGRERVLEVHERIAVGSGQATLYGAASSCGPDDPDGEFRDSPLSRAAEHNDLADYHYRARHAENAEAHNALAIKYCDAAMNNEQTRLAACFIKAMALMRESDHWGALNCISDALAVSEPAAELYYFRGLVLFAVGHHQEAAKDFRKAITESPRWCRPSDLARLGKARLAELADKCAPALDEPEEARILYDQAVRLAGLGNLKMAGECLREAVKAGLVLTLQRLDDVASAVWSGGRTQKAIESFLALLWSGFSLPGEELSRLVGKIGAAFSDVGDFNSEIDYTLAASVLAEGREAWLHVNMGCFFLETASPFYDPVAALREAATAISLDECFASAWNCKADACRRLSMPEEAVEAYRHSCGLAGPSVALAHFELATRFTERVGAEEARRLLGVARDLFGSREQEAAELYTIESMVFWLYAAARTCALLGDETYRGWAGKAYERASRTLELKPYCWSLDRNGTIEEFNKECRDLGTVFQSGRR